MKRLSAKFLIMGKIFRLENTNYVNALLFSLFFIAVLASYIQKRQASKHFSGIVDNVETSYKYKVNYLNISLKDTKKLKVKYPNSFFNVAEFLRIREGDSLDYSTLRDEVSSIKNLETGNELDELYFSIQELKGTQILILLLLLIYNIIQMKKLRDLVSALKKNQEKAARTSIQIANNFTKKYAMFTFIVLAVAIFLIYLVLSALNENQIFFENYYLYKYFILLFSFLIPLPFVIANNRLLKKMNSQNR